MEKFVLDISEVEKEKYIALKHFPERVRCTYGKHKMDFDVIMEDLEPNIDKIHQQYKNKGYKDESFFINPIGFNIASMPIGAKLERVE